MSSQICSEPDEIFYVDGSLAIGKILYTDIDLTTPLLGYSFVARSSNGKIYNINPATGEILSFTGSICGTGIAGSYRLGNNAGLVCGNNLKTLYTEGNFQTGKIVCKDINLESVQTGYTFIVTADGIIYNLDSTTGEVGNATGGVCLPGAIATYILGNNVNTICGKNYSYLYTLEGTEIGAILYEDIGLTIPKTGYSFLVDVVTQNIYELDSLTGEIIDKVKFSCNSDIANATAESETIIVVSNYNFINSGSSFESSKIIQAVMIDSRKGTAYENKNGNVIKTFTDTAISEIEGDVLFYKIETKNGNLAGYFTLEISGDGKVASVQTIKLRPAFLTANSTISDDINQFIISNTWKGDIL